MKKKFLKGVTATVVVALVGYGVSRSVNNSNTELNDLVLANVEALAFYESGGKNTGPGEVVDCKGLGTGNKKVCLSTNTNPCSETECF